MDWSRVEVEAIVADYLQMLTLELAGQSYNKTTHRENLKLKLQSRSDPSIEFKHSNISAAMLISASREARNVAAQQLIDARLRNAAMLCRFKLRPAVF